MRKDAWAGVLAGTAVAALLAQAALSVARGAAKAFLRAPPLMQLACLAGAGAVALWALDSAGNAAKDPPHA
jgi:hypothetical protein